MLDLRTPFGAHVLKRRWTDDTEADEEHVRLHIHTPVISTATTGQTGFPKENLSA